MVIPKTYGRLGNFLFQVASAIGYAKRHNLDFTVPTRTKDPKWNPVYLQHLANPDYNPAIPVVRVTERGHAYQEIPFKQTWRARNIELDGYWQSERYFKEWRFSILDLFGYPWSKSPGVWVFTSAGEIMSSWRINTPRSRSPGMLGPWIISGGSFPE